VRESAIICPRLLQVEIWLIRWLYNLLNFKVVPESHVTWATSVPILVFLGLSVLDLGPVASDALSHFLPGFVNGVKCRALIGW